ncbi:hypothetical protein J6590_027829, partial [Homalodisca vitripennis]
RPTAGTPQVVRVQCKAKRPTPSRQWQVLTRQSCTRSVGPASGDTIYTCNLSP